MEEAKAAEEVIRTQKGSALNSYKTAIAARSLLCFAPGTTIRRKSLLHSPSPPPHHDLFEAVAIFWGLSADGCDRSARTKDPQAVRRDFVKTTVETNEADNETGVRGPFAGVSSSVSSLPCSHCHRALLQRGREEMGSSQILLKMDTIFRRAEQEDDLGAIIARIYDICS